MADKKLESFKIGDKQKPLVKATATPKGKAEAAPPPEAQTFGFERIEAILDQVPPSEVSQNLAAHRAALQALEGEAKTPKDRAAAKKAVVAIDRTADLLDYLFRTKAAMLAPLAEAQKAAAQGKGKARNKGKK
jgi:hypothetical protein